MTIIFAKSKGPVRWPTWDSHDPDAKRFYRMEYAPPEWTANTPVTENVHIAIPTVDNGCMYVCTSGGTTGLTEPVWGTVEDETTKDNDVEWTCYPRNSVLKNGDSVTVSTWAGDTGCTFDNASTIDGIATKVRLTAVPADTDAVTITNHVTITRLNGDVEEIDRSLYIPITQT